MICQNSCTQFTLTGILTINTEKECNIINFVLLTTQFIHSLQFEQETQKITFS